MHMTDSEFQKTKLEIVLMIWTALNVAVGIWVIATGDVKVYGTGLSVFAPLVIGLAAAGLLLWRLFKPTRSVLILGTLFWALQIVSVRLPNALYAFRLGLAINFRLTDNPGCVVSVNLLAILVTISFAIAAVRRSSVKPQAAVVS
jgi:hypothetical protein